MLSDNNVEILNHYLCFCGSLGEILKCFVIDNDYHYSYLHAIPATKEENMMCS